jgi:hypothetical protein
MGIFDGVQNFFKELDAFMDDASARRLGNGAAFYGKRKSNFYGEGDKMKKEDPQRVDASEDYMGPTTAGYFRKIHRCDSYCSCSTDSTLSLFSNNVFDQNGYLTKMAKCAQ